jgi:cephalosporin-C deacetylase-like acetyl esterase
MCRAFLFLMLFSPGIVFAQPIPNTKPLEEKGDLARVMVDGIHKYLDRAIAEAPIRRVSALREHFDLPGALGVVAKRLPPKLEYISGPGKPSLLATIEGCQVHAVRWAVLPGIDAEGLLIEPRDKPRAQVVAVPHCEQTPEEVAGLVKGDPFGLKLAANGCRVLIPLLINRQDELSSNSRIGRQTNIPHREFIHRMAFELGRTMPGYEVQKILAANDWFDSFEKLPLGVIGYGEGGMLALFAGAIDQRIKVTQVSGYFGNHDQVHEEPLDRNIWGLNTKYGNAELAIKIAPREVILDTLTPYPTWTGPQPAKPGRGGAAPGRLASQKEPNEELRRYHELRDKGPLLQRQARENDQVDTDQFLTVLGLKSRVYQLQLPELAIKPDMTGRHARQFEQPVNYTQKLWRDSDRIRAEQWKHIDASSPQSWEKSSASLRDRFHKELIGQLPYPTKPLNPRTRMLHETEKWTSYEVVLDVYDDVIAYGILCLPKGMKPGEKRAVVVCQHGLEGRPTDIVHPNEKSKFYNTFGTKLADMGYIVYAPQNPYIFQNHFRQIQRKANPLKLSLFSFIIEQHRRTLDWLEKLPEVDPERIGFYGLSYGGKTAMRVPAVEQRYAISICSGDFNEWLGKNVSTEHYSSYMYTGEYEMYEFNLGNTFNYAEMAYLIAPRPFMVERGHDDGVGTDEMIAYEYAKVRYLYANRLSIASRTELEFNRGGHEIFMKGTLSFIQKHLGKP